LLSGIKIAEFLTALYSHQQLVSVCQINHAIPKTAQFSGEKKSIEHKVFSISTTFV